LSQASEDEIWEGIASHLLTSDDIVPLVLNDSGELEAEVALPPIFVNQVKIIFVLVFLS